MSSPLKGRRRGPRSTILYVRDAAPSAIRRFGFLVRVRGDGQGKTFSALMALYDELRGDPRHHALLERHHLTGEVKYPQ
jgi:hypothetical protein